MFEIARLQMLQLTSTRRGWLLACLLAVPAGLTWIVNAAGGFVGPYELESLGVYLFMLYPYVWAVLLTLLWGTSVWNEELENKTITYLFTRPVSKWRIMVGKYAALVAVLSAGFSVSLMLSWVLLGAPGGARFFLALWIATCCAVAAYTAIFMIFAVLLPKRPMVIGLLYALVIEGFISFVPAVINKCTVTYYLRSLTVRVMDLKELQLSPEIARAVGDASVPQALFTLASIAVAALAVASFIATHREYVVAEEV